MVFKYSKKDLGKLFDNKEFSKLLEIYSSCASKEETIILKNFIEKYSSGLTYEEIKNMVTTEVITKVREHNRNEEYNSFEPMKKKVTNNTDYLTSEENTFKKSIRKEIKNYISVNSSNISESTYITLKQIYNTSKDSTYLGLYDIQYEVDSYLENGINFIKNADFNKKVKIVNNFDLMINKISNCNEESQSYGTLIIKIPKSALSSRSVPIYYINDDGHIFLNPKYIVCYVPVKNKKILTVEINNSMKEIESTVFEGERIQEKAFGI